MSEPIRRQRCADPKLLAKLSSSKVVESNVDQSVPDGLFSSFLAIEPEMAPR